MTDGTEDREEDKKALTESVFQGEGDFGTKVLVEQFPVMMNSYRTEHFTG